MDEFLIGAEIAPPSALLAQLAEGLHAMAQPLTVLRGALGAMQLSERGAPQHRRYLEMSATQTERLCDMMSNLRSLLDTAQFAGVCVPLDLRELLAPIVEDFAAVLEQSGIRIAASGPSQPIQAFADPARTEQALRAALQAVAAVSSRGDEIQFQILPEDGFVGLLLRNGHTHGKSLGSSGRLALSLVEASLRSQQGAYQFIEDPFCLSIRLRLPNFDQTSARVTSDCLETAV